MPPKAGTSQGLQRGLLTPAILLLLHERSRHGYALCADLADQGLIAADSASVYRALSQLERSKSVRARWEARSQGPARKVYSITARGSTELAGWMKVIRNQHEIVSTILREYRNGRRRS